LNTSGRHVRGAVALLLSLAILAVHPAQSEEAPPAASAAQVAEGSEDLTAEPTPSPWQETAAKVVDVFPIRVLGACATVVGFGAFLISVPLVAPAGRMQAIRESWDVFVLGPVDYTFVRPLGEL